METGSVGGIHFPTEEVFGIGGPYLLAPRIGGAEFNTRVAKARRHKRLSDMYLSNAMI